MVDIRGVVFDAYGTLFDVHSIGSKVEQLFPGMGAAISTVWRDKQIEYSRLVSLSDPSSKGSRHYQSFWTLTRAALEYSLDRLDLAYDQMRGKPSRMTTCLFNFMNRLLEGHGVKGDAALYESRGKALQEQGYAPLLSMLKIGPGAG